MTSYGFLHTSKVHEATFDALLARLRPDAQRVHMVDESLLRDARQRGPQSVTGRVREHLDRLKHRGASVVCCTCSTIGEIAEQNALAIPVFRVDRPMGAKAVRSGPRIVVVAALESTLEPTRHLLEHEARTAGEDITLTLITAEGAWELFEAGAQDGYLDVITQTARHAAANASVIVLAQASMAAAEPLLQDLTVSVLSSPRLAADHLSSTY
ncbi:MAG TPA: aspartate/glutamate racemase family protein [Candidatus Luteococcus avicola]|nr:aspartate/glutamate racemase family protein [Candidatus Luteococcus avicola]